MSRQRKLYLALAAVAALTALVPATSSATYFPYFYWGATGEYRTVNQGTQTLTIGESPKGGPYGTMKCSSAVGSGSLNSFDNTKFELTVNYSQCIMFGLGGVKVSPAKFRYHADGRLDLLEPWTINNQLLGCSVTIEPQSNLTTVHYSNNYPAGTVNVNLAVTGLTYTTSNPKSACGPGDTNGTLSGLNTLEMVSGASVTWEPW